MCRLDVSNFKTWRVLVVDDDLDSLRMIELMLGAFYIGSVLAADGEQALELLQQDTGINLVLLDIQMPIMSGFDFLDIVRATTSWCELPIIAVTARGMIGERERALVAGFDGYIVKPFHTDNLIHLVRSILADVVTVRDRAIPG